MRLVVINVLEKLLGTADRLARMHEFVLRFRARILAMINDVDSDVAAAALVLVQTLARSVVERAGTFGCTLRSGRAR